jgi:hypothetical protein
LKVIIAFSSFSSDDQKVSHKKGQIVDPALLLLTIPQNYQPDGIGFIGFGKMPQLPFNNFFQDTGHCTGNRLVQTFIFSSRQQPIEISSLDVVIFPLW